ncbi:Fic/DOC family protein [Bradyrhizobium guangzhouense]|uniref:protein adenylyltransferase n=1 Tax=Bradyrhizobium guangzhouense TaxID=1325095 RepID=A0AAE6C676_9BRAD|nr:Fic family protein [Bradyrhizobium guangzhouense]QAU44156.1 cell filamentation protein Fic [Bradyrhizobium guangzhouense]RXH11518.1 cell filamentation protein Fic [Bradyrhizobium guangzhouense]
MTFDPFGDFATRGYLRNVAKAKDPAIVHRLLHNSFLTGIDAALEHLKARPSLGYTDVLQTHKTLFEGVFPWAGEDRLANASHIFVKKDSVIFAHPNDIRKAIDYALERGQDKAFMVEKPGEVMGYLAYGHPFLDGNGRTIMLIHAELARRAGIGIAWVATDKDKYLAALTEELEEPGKGKLDAYLKPFIRKGSEKNTADAIKAAPGLDGGNADTVAGETNNPTLKAQYEAQEVKRKGEQGAGQNE